MLEAIAGVSTLLFVVASVAVGARLLLIARRTRGLPEFVMGFGMLVIAGVGYPLSLIGRGVAAESPELARWLLASSAVPLALGWAAVWVFTWKVFRPGSVVCQWVVRVVLVTMALLMLSAMHYQLTRPDPAHVAQSNLRLWGNSLVALCAYLWAGFEAFHYWAAMRKRVAIGLADPVVANRFLLFGLVTVFSVVAVGVSTVAGIAGVNTAESPPIMLTVAAAGSMSGISMWLAFMPPQAYVRRVQATGA